MNMMTELRIEPYEIPAADLGPENPLPHFGAEVKDYPPNVHDEVTEEERRYMGWRAGYRVLPYRMQDGYNREKRLRKFRGIVLENAFLRATFLPELGGRLVSLVHKPSDRELLDRNPVFQPANLALRNAWISGGVEWNVSQIGHHFLTCSPLYAARVTGTQGEPVLRLYEWDRVQCFPYQIDFHLPPGSEFLFARVRIVNPHDRVLPMYWWTNIAVPETPDARVLGPSDAVFHRYDGKFGVVPLPIINNIDMTYTTRVPHSDEAFFRIPTGQRPWIAHLDASGRGLVHASSRQLKGRKLFCWGHSAGSRHWQEFLAEPGCAYLEIQAGLGRIQGENIPMPARAEWTWIEAFGLLEANPRDVHATDWGTARRAGETALEARLPQPQLDNYHDQFAGVMRRPADEILAQGSGWAALERLRLAKCNQADNIPAELDYNNLGEDQRPWVALLERGVLPERRPEEHPGSLMTQPEWRELLEQNLRAGRGDHWLSWWHLGNMRMEAIDFAGAREAWEKSLRHKRTGWALRNLAELAHREAGIAALAAGTKPGTTIEPTPAECDWRRQAWETGPQIAALAVEYAQALVKLDRFDQLREFIQGLPAEIRNNDRLLIIGAQAALRHGMLDEVEKIFTHNFATIREGEITLTDLWFGYHEQRVATAQKIQVDDALRERVRRDFPPPFNIDFRMAR